MPEKEKSDEDNADNGNAENGSADTRGREAASGLEFAMRFVIVLGIVFCT
jgi:hypothetical protein